MEFNVKARTLSSVDDKAVMHRATRRNKTQSIQTTTPLCWDPPPAAIRGLPVFQNETESWPSCLPSPPFLPDSPCSHPALLPPIINLDKSTNHCLACSICLPHSCTARENLSASLPASRLSSRHT